MTLIYQYKNFKEVYSILNKTLKKLEQMQNFSDADMKIYKKNNEWNLEIEIVPTNKINLKFK